MDRLSIRINLFRWELIPFYTTTNKIPNLDNIKKFNFYVNCRFLCVELSFKRTIIKK
jgi:hypothetical protein